jgi:lysophospholipid acyltransferase (LPLAT)-like uncharacterized protein
MSLRKRIASSERFTSTVERLMAAYIRFVVRTSIWERTGFEKMDSLLKNGEPVIVVLWHQRLFMSPYLFNTDVGKICSLTSTSRAGQMAGRWQKLFGFDTIAMNSRKRHITLSREVLGKINAGYSIGIAADGSRGPARVCSTVPLVWSRVSGKRVFVVSFSSRGAFTLPTWDSAMLPRPWTRGVLMCQEWHGKVPRKASPEETETLRLDLQSALDRITDASDGAVGRPLGPRGQGRPGEDEDES